MLADGTRRSLAELKVGDSVLTVNRAGQLEFSPVILFLDRDPREARQFYTVKTEAGHKLTLTPSHLLYANVDTDGAFGGEIIDNQVEEDFSSFEAVFAKDVREGDFVLVQDGRGGLKPTRIVSIDIGVEMGVFAPLTSTGNLVVDNVVASCYAVVDSQTVAHAAFAPFRWANSLASILPATPLTASATSDVPAGVHWYADMLYSAARQFMSNHLESP